MNMISIAVEAMTITACLKKAIGTTQFEKWSRPNYMISEKDRVNIQENNLLTVEVDHFKIEILKLHAEGKSIRAIARAIKRKYKEEYFFEVNDRAVEQIVGDSSNIDLIDTLSRDVLDDVISMKLTNPIHRLEELHKAYEQIADDKDLTIENKIRLRRGILKDIKYETDSIRKTGASVKKRKLSRNTAVS